MGATFDLENLKKEMPYKWRVQSFSQYKASAKCVSYVDSRLVQDLLDEVVGPENWQDKYQEIKGNLFCSIGIKVNGEWTWKSDCGTESNVDKQKGESSDAFKRAAVKWGIARFLYSLKMVTVQSNAKKEGSNKPYVVDPNGNQVWDLTTYINGSNSGGGGGNNPAANSTVEMCPAEYLMVGNIEKNWNGTLYGDCVYFNNTKYKLDKETVEKFKNHPKYKPQTK